MSNDVFVGLDWAVHTHAVCLIDATGSVLDRFEITHDRDGLAELMRRLARHGQCLRIAIERPSGLIVDALVEAGHQVFRSTPTPSKPVARATAVTAPERLLGRLLAGRSAAHRWPSLARTGPPV